MLVTNPRDT